MKWRKLGRIFCPDNNYDWMVSHAANPFAEYLYEDIFRIYFSCRDINNRSSIAYIEININNPNDILKLSKEPLLVPGSRGAFDDSGVTISCIIDIDRKKYMYYLGWFLGVTIPFRNSIALAIAEEDSIIFKKYSEVPIFDRNGIDPYSLSYPWIIKEDKLKMWYGSNLRWGNEGKGKDYGISNMPNLKTELTGLGMEKSALISNQVMNMQYPDLQYSKMIIFIKCGIHTGARNIELAMLNLKMDLIGSGKMRKRELMFPNKVGILR